MTEAAMKPLERSVSRSLELSGKALLDFNLVTVHMELLQLYISATDSTSAWNRLAGVVEQLSANQNRWRKVSFDIPGHELYLHPHELTSLEDIYLKCGNLHNLRNETIEPSTSFPCLRRVKTSMAFDLEFADEHTLASVRQLETLDMSHVDYIGDPCAGSDISDTHLSSPIIVRPNLLRVRFKAELPGIFDENPSPPYTCHFFRTYTCPAITSLALSNCDVELLQLVHDFLGRGSPSLSSLSLQLMNVMTLDMDSRDYPTEKQLQNDVIITCLRKCPALRFLFIHNSRYEIGQGLPVKSELWVALSERSGQTMALVPKLEKLTLRDSMARDGGFKELISVRWNATESSLRCIELKNCVEYFDSNGSVPLHRGWLKSESWKEVVAYINEGLNLSLIVNLGTGLV